MSILMVRKPSETPNISNIDDIIPFRYAYGNQSGYVIGRGNELSHTIEGNQFKINSGRVVLQGVESEIDANGFTILLDNISTETRYYVVYYNVNLGLNETSIQSTYDTVGYPEISVGDDLTANTSGSANLELYRFKATNGVISEVQKTVKAIEYSGSALVGYDISKGTIEERLDRLGFKEAAISYGRLYRQGNFVIGYVNFDDRYNMRPSFPYNLGTIPSDFIPKEEFRTTCDVVYDTSGELVTTRVRELVIDTDGNMRVESNETDWHTMYSFSTKIGYEAKPIE